MKNPSGQSVRIASLDGLRAISIAFVFIGHLNGTENYSGIFHRFGHLAEFGVRVFFVLSGFLITTLLLKELEVTHRISLKNFYLRRVFRIFPASYTYILVIAVLAGFHLVQLHHHDLLHAATYTSNYYQGRGWYTGHLWSLSVEEQFYLLWPLTLWIAGRRRGMMVAALVCVAAPFVRTAEFAYVPAAHLAIGEWFETIADSLAVGCLLAGLRDWLSEQKHYLQFLSSKFFVIVPIFILGITIFPPRLRYEYTLIFTMLNVGIALCLDWSLRFTDNPVSAFLNWRPVAFIGVLSYSLYLWQQPFLDRYVKSPLTAFPLNVILAFAAALISYYVIEKPFLKLKKRFEPRRVKQEVVSEAKTQCQDKTAGEPAS
jgi:peptidoglycan/LPS O-acetylase OafA/YrhL